MRLELTPPKVRAAAWFRKTPRITWFMAMLNQLIFGWIEILGIYTTHIPEKGYLIGLV